MSEDFEPIEKVEPPCQIYYLQSSSGKVYRCYIKSEADKVIAHNKYKRCMLIAKWCFEKSYSTTLVKYEKESGYRLNFYDWWGKRWLELAENFKEA